MTQAYIEINNLNKVIKGVSILNNINLKLEKGKIYGFKGINGSGKTMLLRAIAGLIKATEGKIIVNGKVIGEDISFPDNMGVIIEYPGFLGNFTGFQNLKIIADINEKIGREEIREAIKSVGLEPDDKRKFKKYSLGMKQRLGIAQAIMEEPDIIILDEPTNALDSEGIKLINDIIFKLKSENKTVLIASHDKESMQMVCDEIFFIENGKIINNEVLRETIAK